MSLLSTIAAEPHRLADLPPRQLPALLAELASVQALVAARMATVANESRDDGLVRITEAAKLMDVTVDWLYRHADELPFARRPGPRQLRFDRVGLEDFLERSARSAA